MMKAYLVVDVSIVELEVFREYVSRISPLIAKHGGEYLVKGAEPTIVLGGDDVPQYVVVIEFPSRQVAEAFLQEREETGLAETFVRGTSGRILLVDGA